MLMRFPAWKVVLIVLTVMIGGLLALPNVVPENARGWLPTQPLKLGLDLQGGASILLEIDPEDLRSNKLRELLRDVREEFRKAPLIATTNQGRRLSDDGKSLFIRPNNASDLSEAMSRVRKMGANVAQGVPNALILTERGDGSFTVALTDDALAKLQADALSNSISAVDRRINASGVVEPTIQRQGENRIVVEVPGVDQAQTKDLVDVLTQAGVLTFNMVDTEADVASYTVGEARNGRIAMMNESQGIVQVVFEEPIITGADLSQAQQAFDEYNRPNISFQLRPAGAARFGKATTENVGKPFAIVLDGRIVSAPRIISPITSGSGQITGDYTVQEAENQAIILRSGALPAKLKVVEQRLVGAGLGADSINQGVNATLVGLGLVAIFMVVIYGLLGVIALTTQVINMALVIGLLSGLGATLTLPGIAGMLLTVGMAVDANVLIYERIRDEQRAGRSVMSSLEAGFREASSTIIDANLTTLLAAVILFILGSGPVRGFAVTLSIGVITSVFCAIVLTRWIIAGWAKVFRPKYVPL
jgi:protein-export membrane protein SecD